jgi:sulfatase modifying factor 1
MRWWAIAGLLLVPSLFLLWPVARSRTYRRLYEPRHLVELAGQAHAISRAGTPRPRSADGEWKSRGFTTRNHGRLRHVSMATRQSLTIAAALFGLLACGCSYDPKIASGVIGCGPGGLQCPHNLVCLPVAPGSGIYACQSAVSALLDAAGAPIDGPAAPDASVPIVETADAAAADVDEPGDGASVSPDVADAATTRDAEPACPATGKGPLMVRAGAYCIDATEVTNRQYQAFLTAKGGDMGGQTSACAGKNTSYDPATGFPPWPFAPDRAEHPVVNVDWCDAAAFCGWAGKRLCGKIGGGSLARNQASDTRVSQWASACSRGGTRTFPYGATYQAGACNVQMLSPPAGSSAPAGASAGCVGGYDGLTDMVGNVEEWIDACGQNDSCAVVGGSFAPAPEQPNCTDTVSEDRRLSIFAVRGFRCCSKD